MAGELARTRVDRGSVGIEFGPAAVQFLVHLFAAADGVGWRAMRYRQRRHIAHATEETIGHSASFIGAEPPCCVGSVRLPGGRRLTTHCICPMSHKEEPADPVRACVRAPGGCGGVEQVFSMRLK